MRSREPEDGGLTYALVGEIDCENASIFGILLDIAREMFVEFAALNHGIHVYR
jgi:hypothetical protein